MLATVIHTYIQKYIHTLIALFEQVFLAAILKNEMQILKMWNQIN